MNRPILLDLFCGAGGAAMGYHRAGFDVLGVDIAPQPHYPFDVYRYDALEYVRENGHLFHAIHASPPCQWGTAYARRPNHVKPSPNLIAETRAEVVRLKQSWGIPYVIEQPEHGRPYMVNPMMLCGSSFGLDVRRHRLFESSLGLFSLVCEHETQAPRFKQATNRTNLRRTVEIGVWRIPLDVQQHAMRIDWMDRVELSQAIPPDYTEFIGWQLIASMRSEAVA